MATEIIITMIYKLIGFLLLELYFLYLQINDYWKVEIFINVYEKE